MNLYGPVQYDFILRIWKVKNLIIKKHENY